MTVGVAGDARQSLADVISLYRKVKNESVIMIPFTTLFDYAHLLKEISQLMRLVNVN